MNQKLGDKFYNFALEIIKIVKTFPKGMVAQELGKQLLRSGTSIAANYEEAKGAFSKDDFIYKLSICFKESRETNLWLRLVKDSDIIDNNQINNLIEESTEIRNILGKSLKTAKSNKFPTS